MADFLGLRCRVVFYQHDVTVHYYLRRTLLSTDNIDTLKVGGDIKEEGEDICSVRVDDFISPLHGDTHGCRNLA